MLAGNSTIIQDEEVAIGVRFSSTINDIVYEINLLNQDVGGERIVQEGQQ